MPGRKYTAGTQYRYGFNGKEEDDEVKGDGNQQDYGMRIYDPRLGRFLSVDPITNQYPELTPYQFASDRPIDGIDLDGLEYSPPVLGTNQGTWLRIGLAAEKPPVIETAIETGITRPGVGSSWFRWLSFGRNVHKEELAKWAKEGFDVEKGLGKFGRVDGIKRNGKIGIIRELKPDSKFGRSAGAEQLMRYLKGAQEKYPHIEEWKMELYLYRSTVGLFYTVQANDNLSSISENFGISIQDLMSLNNINSKNADILQIGEVLLVDVGLIDTRNKLSPAAKDNTNAPISTPVLSQEEILNPGKYKKTKEQESNQRKQKAKERKEKRKAPMSDITA